MYSVLFVHCDLFFFMFVLFFFFVWFFFLMIRRPPRSTLDRSSAASDVYKRQSFWWESGKGTGLFWNRQRIIFPKTGFDSVVWSVSCSLKRTMRNVKPVSYTHLRAHETVLDLVCRLLLEKKKNEKRQKEKKKKNRKKTKHEDKHTTIGEYDVYKRERDEWEWIYIASMTVRWFSD